MPDLGPVDYITKTEAARLYRRSERSISRDITNAVKFVDQRVLQHVELHLEDGTRRPGTELTIEEIVELRDRGLNPTWLLQTTWLRNTYGRRDEPVPTGDRNIDSALPQERIVDSPQPLPDNRQQHIAVLTAQNDALRQANSDLRKQSERLEKELDRRAEERREENELQKQNNVLMQQVYNLLSGMQDSSSPSNILPIPIHAQTPPERPTPIDADSPVDKEGSSDPQPSTGRIKNTRKQSAAKQRSSRAAKHPPSSKPQSGQPGKTVLRRWFPTFLGSARGEKR
jgi:hypothetical protein